METRRDRPKAWGRKNKPQKTGLYKSALDIDTETKCSPANLTVNGLGELRSEEETDDDGNERDPSANISPAHV